MFRKESPDCIRVRVPPKRKRLRKGQQVHLARHIYVETIAHWLKYVQYTGLSQKVYMALSRPAASSRPVVSKASSERHGAWPSDGPVPRDVSSVTVRGLPGTWLPWLIRATVTVRSRCRWSRGSGCLIADACPQIYVELSRPTRLLRRSNAMLARC